MSDLDTLESGISHIKELLGVVVEDRSPLVIASALDAVHAVGEELRGAQAVASDPSERDGLTLLGEYMQRLSGMLHAMLPQPSVR